MSKAYLLLEDGTVLLHADPRQGLYSKTSLGALLAFEQGEIVLLPVRVGEIDLLQQLLHLLGRVPRTGDQGLAASTICCLADS